MPTEVNLYSKTCIFTSVNLKEWLCKISCTPKLWSNKYCHLVHTFWSGWMYNWMYNLERSSLWWSVFEGQRHYSALNKVLINLNLFLLFMSQLDSFVRFCCCCMKSYILSKSFWSFMDTSLLHIFFVLYLILSGNPSEQKMR